MTKSCLFAMVATVFLGCGGGDDGSAQPDGGGGEPDGDTGCTCTVGQACDEATNECHYADTLFFTVQEQVIQTSATLDRSVAISACTFHASEFATNPPPPTAEEGACKVYTGTGSIQGAMESFRGDAGTITLKTSLYPNLALDTPSGTNPCYTKDLGTATDLFTAGEDIMFSATGGAHIPAFSDKVKAPAPVSTNVAAITRGSALPLTWSADGALNFAIEVITVNDAGAYTYILCTPPDTGSYTIPAAMTGYLRQDTTGVQLSLSRSNAALVQPPGSMVAVDLFADTIYIALPTYNAQ